MLNFLFWNLNRKYLTPFISRLTVRHQIDVLMLAECSISPGDMLARLNEGATQYHYSPCVGCKKIEVYTRFSARFLRQFQESDRLTIRRLTLPGCNEILLAIVHMQSKLHQSEQSQADQCHVLSLEVRDAERLAGHQRTVLVGDFNMNPFEHGMVSAAGLHAVMSRRIAQQGSRTVLKTPYPFFYNPMWQHFGDADDGPPGTYYYQRSEYINYFWNTFDQVLLRPGLLNTFRSDSLHILTTDGQTSLTNEQGIPDKKSASDHLPLVFRLDL